MYRYYFSTKRDKPSNRYEEDNVFNRIVCSVPISGTERCEATQQSE